MFFPWSFLELLLVLLWNFSLFFDLWYSSSVPCYSPYVSPFIPFVLSLWTPGSSFVLPFVLPFVLLWFCPGVWQLGAGWSRSLSPSLWKCYVENTRNMIQQDGRTAIARQRSVMLKEHMKNNQFSIRGSTSERTLSDRVAGSPGVTRKQLSNTTTFSVSNTVTAVCSGHDRETVLKIDLSIGMVKTVSGRICSMSSLFGFREWHVSRLWLRWISYLLDLSRPHEFQWNGQVRLDHSRPHGFAVDRSKHSPWVRFVRASLVGFVVLCGARGRAGPRKRDWSIVLANAIKSARRVGRFEKLQGGIFLPIPPALERSCGVPRLFLMWGSYVYLVHQRHEDDTFRECVALTLPSRCFHRCEDLLRRGSRVQMWPQSCGCGDSWFLNHVDLGSVVHSLSSIVTVLTLERCTCTGWSRWTRWSCFCGPARLRVRFLSVWVTLHSWILLLSSFVDRGRHPQLCAGILVSATASLGCRSVCFRSTDHSWYLQETVRKARRHDREKMCHNFWVFSEGQRSAGFSGLCRSRRSWPSWSVCSASAPSVLLCCTRSLDATNEKNQWIQRPQPTTRQRPWDLLCAQREKTNWHCQLHLVRVCQKNCIGAACLWTVNCPWVTLSAIWSFALLCVMATNSSWWVCSHYPSMLARRAWVTSRTPRILPLISIWNTASFFAALNSTLGGTDDFWRIGTHWTTPSRYPPSVFFRSAKESTGWPFANLPSAWCGFFFDPRTGTKSAPSPGS